MTSSSAIATPSDVLQFWFGANTPTDAAAHSMKAQWFTKSDAFDAEVSQRFGATIEAARKGELDGWASEPLGWLALLIVLDQFTRNVYRGQPDSFAGDAAAMRWAERGVDQGWDQALPFMARAFVYLPLEHAEDMARQDRSVKAFQALLADAKSQEASEETLAVINSNLDYAERHRDVIRSYGRFPHRNAILGRASTPEEEIYMAQPGAGF